MRKYVYTILNYYEATDEQVALSLNQCRDNCRRSLDGEQIILKYDPDILPDDIVPLSMEEIRIIINDTDKGNWIDDTAIL